MLGHDPALTTAENYRRFAREEAAGRSPLYAELCAGVAGDDELLAFLSARPPAARQPNLLLATVRYLFGTQPDYSAFRRAVLDHPGIVAEVLQTRRT